MSDVKARRYNSPLREQQAAASRAAVLAAARELFVEQGYGATTIEQIAARAGVSKPTVFTAVGNKQTLLKTVRDVAMAGDDDPTPVGQRPSMQRARDAADQESALQEIAGHIAALQARYSPVDEVFRGAAASGDAALRELWRTSEEQRYLGAGLLVDILLGKGPLRAGLDRSTAVDVLSLFMAPDVHARLVTRRGWSETTYREWLSRTLAAQLLDGS
jgi:AcrR family transcriptional regulator